MADDSLQLLVIFERLHGQARENAQKLFGILTNLLRENDAAARTALLDLAEADESGTLRPVLEQRWTHLVIVLWPDRDWSRLADRFGLSSLLSPRSIIWLADGDSAPEYPGFWYRFAFDRGVPVHTVRIADSVRELDSIRESLEPSRLRDLEIAGTALRILHIIRRETPGAAGENLANIATAYLRRLAAGPASPRPASGPVPQSAPSVSQRPEPNSAAVLMERRAAAEIERVRIPAARIDRAASRDILPGSILGNLVAATATGYVVSGNIAASGSAGASARARPRAPATPDLARASRTPPSPKGTPGPAFEPRRSRGVNFVRWLLLGASIGAAAALFLYRRDLFGAAAPLVKLFGSSVPSAPSVDPPPTAGAADADQVELAAFGPRSCENGETILIQALLHLPAEREAARVMALEADAAAARKGTQALSIAIRRGEQLDIDLEAEACQIDEVRQTVVWQGETVAVQFFAQVPRQRKKPIPVRITALRSGIPVGRIRFTVQVRNGAERKPIEARGDDARRFERAFVSYASEDRVPVLGYAQLLHLTGIEVFQDILSLEPGERWKRRLYLEIDRSDLFVLFWSKAASQSKWVIKEAKYAQQSYDSSGHRSPTIRPYLLEGPPPPEIPASLKKSIHFNDKFRYMIAGAKVEAEALRRQPRGKRPRGS